MKEGTRIIFFIVGVRFYVCCLIIQILVVSLAKDASASTKSKNNNSALKYKDEADNYYKQKKYREVCFLRSL